MLRERERERGSEGAGGSKEGAMTDCVLLARWLRRDGLVDDYGVLAHVSVEEKSRSKGLSEEQCFR